MSQDIEELIAEKRSWRSPCFIGRSFTTIRKKCLRTSQTPFQVQNLFGKFAFWPLFGRGNLVEVQLRNQESEETTGES